MMGKDVGSCDFLPRPTRFPDRWRDNPLVHHWTYRVMRRLVEDEPDRLAIHEVFWTCRDEAIAWSVDPLALQADAAARSDLDLAAEFDFMQQALLLPVLDLATGEEIGPPCVSGNREKAIPN